MGGSETVTADPDLRCGSEDVRWMDGAYFSLLAGESRFVGRW